MAGNGMHDLARARIKATGARITGPRVQVLAALLASQGALTHHEIEAILGAARLDRVTLYRVLDWLVGRGFAHRIAGADRVWRFSMAGETHGAHAHFKCSRCGKVLCLDKLSSQGIRLSVPRGCRPERMELTVTGLCEACA